MKYTEAIKKAETGYIKISGEIVQNGLLRKIDKKRFEIQEEFIWYLDYENKSTYIIVEKGFITDFGSIPKIMQSIFSPTDYLAYILHDSLYSKGKYIIYQDENETHLITPSRELADDIMRKALQVEKSSFLERNIIYFGVRIGGRNNFRK